MIVFLVNAKKKTRAVVGQRSSPAGYILYCNIFIIKPYNIGHTDLDVFVCKSFLSHRYNNPGMTILHEIVIKIKGKITEAWNIGHNDLDIVSGHSLGHMELISQVWHLSNK